MIRAQAWFDDVSEAWEWVAVQRDGYPDCIDYVEVLRHSDGSYTFAINIYTELKRESSAMGRRVSTETRL